MEECPIKNLALAKKVAAQLNLGVQELSIEALNRLEDLDASDLGLGNLDGLQHCRNLTILSLQDNSITDIAPLAGLTSLETLSLNGNPIADLSAIKSLRELRNLYLGKTLVSDLSFVRELPNLRLLSFAFSKVTTLIELYFALVLGSVPRLEKVYAFGNKLDLTSHAFAAALRNAGVEVQI